MATRLATLALSCRSVAPTPFRTGSTVQLSDALDSIVTRSVGLPTKAAEDKLDARAASLGADEEVAVNSALASIERLQACKALDEFPISPTLLHPVHDPHYYTRMRDGIHRAQQGISRSWWKRFFQVRGAA